jgi:hypothetical protein
MGAKIKSNTKNNKPSKNSAGLLFKHLTKIGLSLFLFNCLTINSVQAEEKTELVNIFLSNSGSLILETKDKKSIENFDLLRRDEKNYQLVLSDTKIDNELLKKFNSNHNGFKIEKQTIKESLFKKKENLAINITCQNNCQANFEDLLGGLAYTLNFEDHNSNDIPVQAFTKNLVDIEIEDQDFKELNFPTQIEKKAEAKLVEVDQALLSHENPVHLLKANKKSNLLFVLSKENSPVEEFLNDLDDSLVNKLMAQEEFQKENLAKADSASLSYIADKLDKEGNQDLSASAYAKALEVDPTNLNAMLGLARTSSDEDEKLKYYLKALDDEALVAIGQKWFQKGLDNQDEKQIAQAMVSYQFAVLKNPQNPYYRFEYAQVLEKAGYSNFEQASKRYLEAAVLAKKDFKAGDLSKESILRKSTECLIKVLTKKGAPDKAVHYCNSYLSLGFKRFLDGRSIKGVMKEISANKNPFQA